MNAEACEWQRPCEWFRELVGFRWLPCGPPRYQFQDKLELVPRAVRLRVRGARASLSGRSPLMLAHVMLAGALVAADSTAELARIVRAAGDVVADRLERALKDEVRLLALTIDERAIVLDQLEDPPDALADRRGVLLNEHEWRQRTGLDP